MPTYEYACPKCGHTFDAFQSMKDELLKKCPKCKKNALKRLIGTGAGLIFKGSGFYITDYKKKSGGDSANGGEGKSESKPAESKPTESKSAESKPTESKPTESKSKESKSTGSGGNAKSSGTASKSP